MVPLIQLLGQYGLILLLLGLLGFLLAGSLAPLGTLRWWARGAHLPELDQISVPEQLPQHDGPFVVYLSGIGDVSGEYISRRELGMLGLLQQHQPTAVIIHEVFGYSVAYQAMQQKPLFGQFWAWLHAQRLEKTGAAPLGKLIDLRNLLQVAISMDRRYGPLYNYGMASLVREALVRRGYSLGSGTPVTVIGYSGGAQIALGLSRYLQPALQAPVQLITIGGVFHGDISLDSLSRVVQLIGSDDRLPGMADWVFPNRWRWNGNTAWRRAQQAGKLISIILPATFHTGSSGYYGSNLVDDQQTHQAQTATTIAGLLAFAPTSQSPVDQAIG